MVSLSVLMCAFGWGEKGEGGNRGKKKREETKIFYSLARKKMLGIGIFHPRPPIWFLPSRGENDRRQ